MVSVQVTWQPTVTLTGTPLVHGDGSQWVHLAGAVTEAPAQPVVDLEQRTLENSTWTTLTTLTPSTTPTGATFEQEVPRTPRRLYRAVVRPTADTIRRVRDKNLLRRVAMKVLDPALASQPRLVQMFLVTGQLVQFRIKPKSTHYRRQGKTISLLDAYVVSGVLAARALPKGQYNPNNPVTPRRYADGLESNDTEENMLFVVFYVPHKVAQAGKVPSLNAAKKMMVFRCRSRVERDVWCWALNTEIEKLARGRRDREQMWRNVGAPIPLDQDGE